MPIECMLAYISVALDPSKMNIEVKRIRTSMCGVLLHHVITVDYSLHSVVQYANRKMFQEICQYY